MTIREADATGLKVEWHDAGAGLDDEARAKILESLDRVAKAVRGFPVTTVHIEVEHRPRKGGWGVSVNLQLPARSLFAAEWSRDLRTASRSAFGKVAFQVSSYRAHLRRHERRSHRRELPETPVPAAAALQREREILEGLRDRVARLVRRELLHDPSLAGVPKEAVSVPDVVDEAMVWTVENLPSRPPFLTPEQFLWRRVLHQLDLARESILRSAAASAEEERVAAAHREPEQEMNMEWADAEDLLFGGGEPLPLDLDEAPRAVSDPASILDREAVQAAVSEALRELPEGQRRAVLLHDLEGYDAAEIAFVLARSEDRVREDLEAARRALRRRLREYA